MATYARRYGPTTPLPPDVARLVREAFEWKPQGAEKFAYILRDLTKQLAALDRYERRVLSRRKFAIRKLDVLRLKSLAPNLIELDRMIGYNSCRILSFGKTNPIAPCRLG